VAPGEYVPRDSLLTTSPPTSVWVGCPFFTAWALIRSPGAGPKTTKYPLFARGLQMPMRRGTVPGGDCRTFRPMTASSRLNGVVKRWTDGCEKATALRVRDSGETSTSPRSGRGKLFSLIQRRLESNPL
jgi:hypothetical protein